MRYAATPRYSHARTIAKFLNPTLSNAELTDLRTAIHHNSNELTPHQQCCQITEDDVVSLIVYRRAVIAGYYNELDDTTTQATLLSRQAIRTRMRARLARLQKDQS